MVRKTLSFGECEHSGDLDKYEADIKHAGGVVIGSHIDFENEEADITIECDDTFFNRFRNTDSFDFMYGIKKS